eukprot:CAMPEP_0197522930 /NCGR_PEP_ID=MMETSP1318-20131121/7970_1 /TAXON_ID=552666 /ORGANISM="Partenskyella glossopodia, Strain RCC365" /LENGTH=241 /DNA_ID=CAMNT_0043075461 /DNA_START=44 /DNA_END=769 /DNA_ORIENTATION=-
MTERTPLNFMAKMTPLEREISAQLDSLGGYIQKMKKQMKQLKSSDRPRTRQKLQRTHKNAMERFYELKRLFGSNPSNTDVMLKLRAQYSTGIGEFLETSSKYDALTRKMQMPPSSGRGESKQAAHEQYQAQKEIEIQVLATHDIDTVRDRNEQVRQMEDDVVELSQVFTDVLDLVKQQREGIEVIEENVTRTRFHVEDADQELLKAELAQKKSTYRKCCWLTIAVMFLFFLVLAWYFKWFD